MNWFTKTVAAFGVAFVGSAAFVNSGIGTTPRQDIIEASVQIGNYCSGTVIEDPNLADGEQVTVITAKHCTSSKAKIGDTVVVNVDVVDPKSDWDNPVRLTKPYVFRIVDLGGKGIDLALLQMTDMNKAKEWTIKPVKIASKPLFEGEHVTVIGYPRGQFKAVTEGFASIPFDVGYDFGVIQVVAALMSPGNSGGGLFNDNNELVGVMVIGYSSTFDYLTGATPFNKLKAFLGEGNGG